MQVRQRLWKFSVINFLHQNNCCRYLSYLSQTYLWQQLSHQYCFFIHYTVPEFPCGGCGKVFSRKFNCDQHTPFSCRGHSAIYQHMWWATQPPFFDQAQVWILTYNLHLHNLDQAHIRLYPLQVHLMRLCEGLNVDLEPLSWGKGCQKKMKEWKRNEKDVKSHNYSSMFCVHFWTYNTFTVKFIVRFQYCPGQFSSCMWVHQNQRCHMLKRFLN